MRATWETSLYCYCRLNSSHFNPIFIGAKIVEHWELLGTVQLASRISVPSKKKKTPAELFKSSIQKQKLKTWSTETETKSTVNGMTETRGLYPTLVANCIVNAFLSYTATVLNIITIQALRKTASLARPLKTLLLSLTVSDLGVRLLVQALYIALLVAVTTEPNTSNSTPVISLFIVFVAIANLFGCASFFGDAALAVDRFLAIHLHLRYQELVTHKRVVVAVILIWVFSAAIFFLFSISINVRFIFSTTTGALTFATAGLLYCKIYAAVRHHRNQINALQVQQVAQNGEMAIAARQRKTAVAKFFVYVVFLACYLPLSNIFITFMFNHYESMSWWHLLFYSLTLGFLSSSLNPLIYCWKMRHVRRAVMDILRNTISRCLH